MRLMARRAFSLFEGSVHELVLELFVKALVALAADAAFLFRQQILIPGGVRIVAYRAYTAV